VHPDDQLFTADLLDSKQVIEALQNTEIAYLTVGLAYDSKIWLRDWVIIQKYHCSLCRK
jgi:hypothetical protein